jgi:fructan beta-fructosidase
MDYGADNYAGVTWFGTGERKISMGWMSNWIYAQQVPTQKWRSATTIARDLSLGVINNEFYLKSMPVKELVFEHTRKMKDSKVNSQNPYQLKITNADVKEFSVTLSNDLGESICFGYDQKQDKYYIDRTNAGQHNFNSEFAAKHVAPRISDSKQINLEVIIDKTSIELFADNGYTVMTDIFFPNKPFNTLKVKGLKMDKENLILSNIKIK